MKFTEKDIAIIKKKIQDLIYYVNIGQEYRLDTFVTSKIISEAQKTTIVNFIKSNGTISFEPLPKELAPVIDAAKHLIEQENKKPKYHYSGYDRWDDYIDYDRYGSPSKYYG